VIRTATVLWNELVAFAIKFLDYDREAARVLLAGVKPEYEITHRLVDLDDMEDEVTELPDQFKDLKQHKEMIRVLRSFCIEHNIDNVFTVIC
jgi:hypothetical protein